MSVKLQCLRFCILVNVPLCILQFSSLQSKWFHRNLVQFVFLFFALQRSSGLVSFNNKLFFYLCFHYSILSLCAFQNYGLVQRFKNRCHRTWHMMIFRVFSLLCSWTHDGQVKKMLQYTWFQRIYQWCVCRYCSLKSAMPKQCRIQQNPYWVCWPAWMFISVIDFLLHSVDFPL